MFMKKFLSVFLLLPFIAACSGPVYTFVVPSDWKTFTHELYNYQFSHPPETIVGGYAKNKKYVDAPESGIVSVSPSTESGIRIIRFSAETFDDVQPESYKIYDLGLSEFAHLTWQNDKMDREEMEADGNHTKLVSNLSSITFNGQEAYTYTTNVSFSGPTNDYGAGWVLSENTTFVFLHGPDGNFVITYPAEDALSQNIAKTFKFLPL